MFKERLISGLFGSMFILIFQPFGLIAFGNYRWVLELGICACIFGSILLVECLLTWVLRMPHDPNRGIQYLVKRNALFQVLNIGMMTISMVFFLDWFCCMEGVDNRLSWGTFIYALLINLGSSMLIGLYWRNVYMKRNYQRQLEEAQYLNGILQERQRIGQQRQTLSNHAPAELTDNVGNLPTVDEVTITGNTKESLTLLPQDFIYAESDGNYVHIHHLKDGTVRKAMIRSSITLVEETMSIAPDILRCHRAFVVNLSHVAKLENHGSTPQLFIKEAKVFIPVSKTYMPIIKERIVEPKK